MIKWREIPASEAEARTRIILEIIAKALRRKASGGQRDEIAKKKN